jgi:Zn-dependent peptidase ImmA (M78 family)
MVRRGFLAAADRLAAAVRTELGLGAYDRLDPFSLAAEYGIPVVPITDLVAEGADPGSIRVLTVLDRSCFSAGTVVAGTSRLIIFNSVHPDGRRANSVTHELAHLLLEHIPGPAIGPGGCRVWDAEMEAEADSLAGVLLVPREAALACARVGLPHAIGAARFGVSAELMRWRTDYSGAARQARAAAQRAGRTIPQLRAHDLRAVLTTCDLGWLQNLTGPQWHSVLAKCGRALAVDSVPRLIKCLKQPIAS